MEQSLPPAISRYLNSQGIDGQDQLEQLISPKLSQLRDPHELSGMKEALRRLEQAYVHQESVCVYADFDLDGSSGLALMWEGLERLGFSRVRGYQPRRLRDGYGLHADAVRDLADQGVSLIITVDVGITALEAAQQARESGIDLIITDHHLPKEELPDCLAVINPNQEECLSELGHLCGAGVAFYLLLGLRRWLRDQGHDIGNFDPKELLDLLAIGTLTDLVPLVQENRVLVKHGLHQLNQTKRQGLLQLRTALSLPAKLGSQDIALRLAPKLNALSRMEEDVFPIDLLRANCPAEAQKLVERALSLNEKRLSRQRHAEQEAIEFCQARGQKGFVWTWSTNYHQGIVGLVATRLAEVFSCPAFVGSQKESGQIIGSARLPENYEGCLQNIMQASADALEHFGGHSAAAGFGLKIDQAEKFEKALSCYFQQSSEKPPAPAKKAHIQAFLSEIDSEFMDWLEKFEPFGVGLEWPLIELERVRVAEIFELRGGHWRLKLTDGPLVRTGIWFAPPERYSAADLLEGTHFRLLVSPQWNEFRGRRSLQLFVHDIRFFEMEEPLL